MSDIRHVLATRSTREAASPLSIEMFLVEGCIERLGQLITILLGHG
jgi:hypothetical protein